ncbi:MAG: elongation factor Ts, partial [Planctomycetota bacterium]
MAITATMVRELRERTGAAMMDCKKALEGADGSMEAAIDNLRKQGLKSAGKKASRDTAEGRVIACLDASGKRGHLVGIACETDFLAKGEGFVEFVGELSKQVIATDPVDAEALLSQEWAGGGDVKAALAAAVGKFGENIQISNCVRMGNDAGQVGAYVHHDNKQGAIASITTEAGAEQAAEVIKSLCQHIVVFNPTFLNQGAVPVEDVEREKAIINESEEIKAKPPEHRDKIVEGKLRKWYSTNTLEDQPW